MPSSHHIKRTDDEIKVALEANGGLVNPSAVALGICRQTLQQRLLHNPDLRRFQLECRNIICDKAESVLARNLDSENDAVAQKAAEYVLNNIGGDRGYGQRLEINGYMRTETLNINLSVLNMDELKALQDIHNKLEGNSLLEDGSVYDTEFTESTEPAISTDITETTIEVTS